jgi:TRAP-type C4-dicarboxylate transport system substrate-binding protein
MMSQVRSGALELATFPGTVMSTLVPVTSITGVGFAFASYDKVWAAMDGSVGNHIRGAIAKANLVPFESVWDNGFRQITTSTKAIQTPADPQEFKIRVPVVPLWVSMFKALGAAP